MGCTKKSQQRSTMHLRSSWVSASYGVANALIRGGNVESLPVQSRVKLQELGGRVVDPTATEKVDRLTYIGERWEFGDPNSGRHITHRAQWPLTSSPCPSRRIRVRRIRPRRRRSPSSPQNPLPSPLASQLAHQ